MADLFSSYDIAAVLFELGVFRRIDYAFASFIYKQESSSHARVISLLAGLLSYSTTGRNNVCLDLRHPLECFNAIRGRLDDTVIKRFDAVCADIIGLFEEVDFSDIFCESSTVSLPESSSQGCRPLVLSDNRLYLLRYWQAEVVIIAAIKERVNSGRMNADITNLAGLETIYQRFSDYEKSWGQQVAVFTALRSDFSIITGGPGTGKTTVVAVILSLCLLQNPDFSIAVAAPTGKAQARLKEAVFEELAYLDIPAEIAEKIRRIEFRTLHSLLGIRRGQSRREGELSYDLVIVDEASMISVLLFQTLFESLSSSTRLIVLGDRDQLAAVEGGAVLSDLCLSVQEPGKYSADYIEAFSTAMSGKLALPEEAGAVDFLQDVIAPLDYTFRFSSDSGIGRMKELLQSDSLEFEKFISTDYMEYADSLEIYGFDSLLPAGMQLQLFDFVQNWGGALGSKESFLSYLDCNSVVEAYRVFMAFQIITPLNKGLLGVEGINNLLLSRLGLDAAGCKGLPVMIESNDYQNLLFNGDIGMYWPDSKGVMKVWFPNSAESADMEFAGFRAVSPAKLPENSPAFAMTIHKSQGSGFDSVLLVLPGVNSEIITKELLYTAITRAKKKLTVFGDASGMITASKIKTYRVSGLTERFDGN